MPAIDDKLELLNQLADWFEELLPSIEKSVLAIALKTVSGFDTVGGALAINQDITAAIEEMREAIFAELRNGGYVARSQEFLGKLPEIAPYNILIQSQTNGITVNPALLSDVQAGVITQARALLLQDQAINVHLVGPITDTLYNAVQNGTGITTIRAELNAVIRGIGGDGGRFGQYVNVTARDTAFVMDGVQNDVIFNEFELDGYRYVGSLVADSRPQCIRWTGMKVILRKDLPAEVAWANANGTGYGKGRKVDIVNFAAVRGGYNCRHTAIPVRLNP